VRLADPSSGRVPESFPVITYANSITVHFNGEEVSATHMANGHTDGDSMIWFKGSNVIHMGDHYFGMAFPYVDLGSNGSVVGLVRNLNAAIAQMPDDIMIIPGHGELSTKTQFAQYIDGVKETSNIVIERIYDGMTLEQILAAGFPAKYDSWGLGFIGEEAWITTIYNSVTQ
jgi:cyclase